MGAIESLSDRDLQTIEECLNAAVDDPFFPGWEFDTLLGFSRDELSVIAQAWPYTDHPTEQNNAVNHLLNMLLGYPHEHWSRWHEYSSATPEEIEQLLARWRGDTHFDETPRAPSTVCVSPSPVLPEPDTRPSNGCDSLLQRPPGRTSSGYQQGGPSA
ncbi:hypothetical protein ACIBEJ_45865 [Nonomuraea sp. NPDC050790]|uniref:hypothetical protein n=1 Tax=Nonomuraea sp. NPDC050790 TaxID=3364371 RepID=UPI003794819F